MFNIITDSTAYFTRKEAQDLNITVIPMTFTIGEERFAEGYAGEQKNHILQIEKASAPCKTAQPNLKVLSDAFERLTANGKKVIYISMSSRLSGAYNSAVLAASQVSQTDIVVFDSLSIAGGEKMLVMRAAQLKEQGCSLEQAVKTLEQERDSIKVLFSVSDMEALRRSGRIGFVKQSISNILNIVPLLRLNAGAVESLTNTRGIYNFLKKVNSYLPKNLQTVTIMAFDEQLLQTMQEYLQKNFPQITKIECQKPGAVLAIHLGARSFGIAWQEEKTANYDMHPKS